MANKDGGPAFPVQTGSDGRGIQTGPASGWETGLSVRDWFAGQALAGIVANTNALNVIVEQAGGMAVVTMKPGSITGRLAACCYEYADAMLAEREKANG